MVAASLLAAGLAVPAVAASKSVTPSVRTCLEQRFGKSVAARIATSKRLTTVQRFQIETCQRAVTPRPASSTPTPPNVSVTVWQNDGKGGWVTSARPPACSALVWQMPIDSLASVETILDPGQVRGGRYKAHGGFRLTTNNVDVRSPIDGYIVNVAKYMEKEERPGMPLVPGQGERQVLLDIQDPCGIQVRFDHLKTLDPALETALAAIPTRTDSQTTFLSKPIAVKRGQLLATQVGHTDTSVNAAFDFGVYDLRTKQYNRRSEADLRSFGPDGQLGMYALCWFDLFGSGNSRALRNFPRTSVEAASGSDVCRP